MSRPAGYGVDPGRRVVRTSVAYGLVLVGLGVGLAAIAWTADVDEAVFRVWFRWSATLGIVLDLVIVGAVLQRSVRGLENVLVLVAARFVVVVLGFLFFGWSDGRSNPSYLLLFALTALPALGSLTLTVSTRLRLRRFGRPVGR